MTTLHYQNIETGRLDFEPDVYISDDTAQIFGEDGGRLAISVRDLLCDSRLRPHQRPFCYGAIATLATIFLVIIILLINGYIHVRHDIADRDTVRQNGLQVIPFGNLDGSFVIRIRLGPVYNKEYVKSISDYLKKYEDEQKSRKFMTDCKPNEKPEKSWCRVNIAKDFQRAGKGCTADDNFGYDSGNPCFLLEFRDAIDWTPKFSKDISTQLPFQCNSVIGWFDSYDLKITYYPAHTLNADFGGFPMNKIPSRMIKSNDSIIMEEDGVESAIDQPALAFIKINLPPTDFRGIVHCSLIRGLTGAQFTNLNDFRGVQEFRFEIIKSILF